MIRLAVGAVLFLGGIATFAAVDSNALAVAGVMASICGAAVWAGE